MPRPDHIINVTVKSYDPNYPLRGIAGLLHDAARSLYDEETPAGPNRPSASHTFTDTMGLNCVVVSWHKDPHTYEDQP